MESGASSVSRVSGNENNFEPMGNRMELDGSSARSARKRNESESAGARWIKCVEGVVVDERRASVSGGGLLEDEANEEP